MRALQRDLMLAGHYLPGVRLEHPDDIAAKAIWSISSEWAMRSIPPGGSWIELTESLALLLPVRRGKLPEFRMRVRSGEPAEIEWQVRVSQRAEEFTPEETLAATCLSLKGGEEEIRWLPGVCIPEDRYIFLTLQRRPGVHLLASDAHFSGLTTVYNGTNKAVGNHCRQSPPVARRGVCAQGRPDVRHGL